MHYPVSRTSHIYNTGLPPVTADPRDITDLIARQRYINRRQFRWLTDEQMQKPLTAGTNPGDERTLVAG
jgi:hypothetical protein